MKYRFTIERHPKGEGRQDLDREKMLDRIDGFLKRGFLFRVRERGQDWSRWLPRSLARGKIAKKTASNDGDPKYFIQRKADMRTLSIHKTEIEPAVPDLGAAPELEKIHAAVWRKFGANGVRSGGRYYCRYVDGTNIVSRHGYRSATWKGSAEDIFSNPDNMTALRVRADYIVSETKAGKLKARTVIVGNDVWTPSSGWQGYGGIYHTHVHVDVEGGYPCL